MKLKELLINKKSFFLFLTLILSVFLFAKPTLASTTARGCETNTSKSGKFCSWEPDLMSWAANNTNDCVVESTATCPANTASSTWAFSCNSNSCRATCVGPTYIDCGGVCQTPLGRPFPNCSNWNTCTGACTGCSNTCTFPDTIRTSDCACVTGTYKTLKLGSDSISSENTGTPVLQGGANAGLFIKYLKVGIATSTPDAALNILGDFHVSSNNLVTIDIFKTFGDGLVTSVGGILGTSPFSALLPTPTDGQTLRASGTSWVANSLLYNNGTKIGIGTTTLLNTLTVSGGISVVNGDVTISNGILSKLTVDKINVGTIDPLYDIFGVKYSSFAASFVGGVKEEVSGKLKINNKIGSEYQTVIDFNKQPVGSDLWVWHKVIDFNKENVEVFITPYGKFANTYYFVKGDSLIFRSNTPVEVSYRLIARRFDWRNWPTLANDQSEKSNLIIK